MLLSFSFIKSLTRGKIYHLKDGLFHFIFLGGSRESEILRKDTIAGNVGLGNSGTSMDVRAYSVACLILRDGLAYYCASISREERPIFVVKLNENDNKDRTKEPKGAYNPRNSLNVSIFCLFVLKKNVIINYLFDITYDNRTTL